MFQTRISGSWLIVALLLSVIALWGVSVHVSVANDPPRETEPDAGLLRSLPDAQTAQMFLRSLESLVGLHRDELGLSDEQLAKLKAIWIDFEKGRIRGEREARLAEMGVWGLSNDEKAELAAIELALIRFATALASIHLQSIKTLRAVQSVLTPGQREKRGQIFATKRLERRQGSAREKIL